VAKAARFARYWLPVIVICGIIFFLSSLPGKSIPSVFASHDKTMHFLAYASLGLFFIRGLRSGEKKAAAYKLVVFSVFFGLIYGLSDEVHQLFVPGRSFDLMDVAFDCLGTLAGALVYR
jgi:VanZ family protein